MKFVRNDGGMAASKHDEINDCACRAIAIATERPYREIWSMFRARLETGASPRIRNGVAEIVQHEVLTSLGWIWIPTPKVTRLRADHLPTGRLVVCIRDHSTAVLDGVLHDTWNCSRNRNGEPPHVFGYYKIGEVQNCALSDDRKKLIDTVAKILALAEGTSYAAEAETAKAKAANLIARYDISVDSLKDIEEFKVQTEFRTGDMPSHEFCLLGVLGCFCGVLVMSTTRQHGGNNYQFFGKPQDIEAFRYMRDIVFAQRYRAWAEYLSKNPDHMRKSASWKNSFADGVEEKTNSLMRAAEKQQKSLRQDIVLVPREKQANEEWTRLFGNLGSYRGYGGEANAHGLEAGRSVSLNRGVNSSLGSIRQIGSP
jgi:hypothetical protein